MAFLNSSIISGKSPGGTVLINVSSHRIQGENVESFSEETLTGQVTSHCILPAFSGLNRVLRSVTTVTVLLLLSFFPLLLADARLRPLPEAFRGIFMVKKCPPMPACGLIITTRRAGCHHESPESTRERPRAPTFAETGLRPVGAHGLRPVALTVPPYAIERVEVLLIVSAARS